MQAQNFQTVVQFMIANGCVKVSEFTAFLVKLLEQNDVSTQLTDEKVAQLVQQVNTKIKKFNLMIRGSLDEVTLEQYYVLISTVANDVTRAASHHTPEQFELFKLTLEAVVNDQRGAISMDTFKQLAEKAYAQKRSNLPEYKLILVQWCEKHWLRSVYEDETDCITLGVRSLAELDVFIKQNFVVANKECRWLKALQ